MTPAIRAAIVAEDRSWLGTRFHHQGRLRGVGVDCAGLVVQVAQALGLSEFDRTDYTPLPDGAMLQAACESQMHRLALAEIQPGDVLLLKFDRHPQHLAIVGDHPLGGLSLIHAYAPARKVVEVRLDEGWRQQVMAAYRFMIPAMEAG